jgi:hypothetical protein
MFSFSRKSFRFRENVLGILIQIFAKHQISQSCSAYLSFSYSYFQENPPKCHGSFSLFCCTLREMATFVNFREMFAKIFAKIVAKLFLIFLVYFCKQFLRKMRKREILLLYVYICGSVTIHDTRRLDRGGGKGVGMSYSIRQWKVLRCR